MTAAESVALAGKLWLNEDDTATYLAPVRSDHPVWKLRVSTLAESNALLVRNLAQAALRNYGTWWMDLSASGQFKDPAMWEQMIRLKAVDEVFLRTPMTYRPQVAAVIDERSMMRVAAGGRCGDEAGRLRSPDSSWPDGAPYGQYHTEDAAAGRVPAKPLRLPHSVVPLRGAAPVALESHCGESAALVLRAWLLRKRTRQARGDAGTNGFRPPARLRRQGLGHAHRAGAEDGVDDGVGS